MPTPKNEYPLATSTVYVDGNAAANLVCTNLELNVGQIPSRAVFVQTFGQDSIGPWVLQTNPYSYGQRVRVDITKSGTTTTVFWGWLLKRSDQCNADKVVWQAFDDRILMQWIAMRGALVYDPIDKLIRYSARHLTHFNPGGFWNCTFWYNSGDGFTYPVFTNTACRTQAYESPNADYSEDTPVGEFAPWTPRRALRYLGLWSRGNPGSILNLDEKNQSFLSASGPFFIWQGDIEDMVGYDPAQSAGTPDPLDRKLDDLNVQGQSLFNVFGSVLGRAGTHALIVEADDEDETKNLTKLNYAQIGYASSTSRDKDIYIQTGGSVGQNANINCFDFVFDEDATQVIGSAYVEGDVARVETKLDFAGGPPSGDDYSDDTVSDIVPAWTWAEQGAYLTCIHGGAPESSGLQYALIPKTQGDTENFLICDGGVAEGHFSEVIWARSPEAILAAKDGYPTVFRAWKLNGRTERMQKLFGLGGSLPVEALVNGTEYVISFVGDTDFTLIGASANTVGTKFTKSGGAGTGTGTCGFAGGLKGPRPILPEQLQFMLRNLGGGTDVQNWMLCHLPIRVQFWNSSTGAWYEVPRDIAARITGDGMIWLDGLAEQASGTSDCIFTGNLIDDRDYTTSKIQLRKMRINCAFPTDSRTSGFRSGYGSVASAMTSAFKSTSSPLCRYHDAGSSFQHGIQSESEPCRTAAYYGGANGTDSVPSPISRDIPPGNETEHAQYAAQRLVARYANPRREAVFRMIGIWPDWLPGCRVGYVNGIDPVVSPGGKNFTMRLVAPISSITHDLLAQQTRLGGILGEYRA